MLTAERLRELVNYDPVKGVITWRVDIKGGTWPKAGQVAGSVMWNGYVRVRIDGRSYAAHRLAWLFMTGAWPAADIDHISGDKSCNKFANLREATKVQNSANVGPKRRNTSGFKGVSRATGSTSRWCARIRKNGRCAHLGTFGTPEEAHAAYCKAAEEHHGQFARFA
jgi:hypothetical protein